MSGEGASDKPRKPAPGWLGTEVTPDRQLKMMFQVEHNGPLIVSVKLQPHVVRSFALDLANKLAALEGRHAPSKIFKRDVPVTVPIPHAHPEWIVAALDTGDPVVAVELLPEIWTAFSLTMRDADYMATCLTAVRDGAPPEVVIEGYRMKLLTSMERNPQGDWTIADIKVLCKAYGFELLPPSGGSHYKVAHPHLREILTVPARKPIKPVYIRKLVRMVRAVGGEA